MVAPRGVVVARMQDLPPSIKRTKTGASFPTGLILFLLIAGSFLYHEVQTYWNDGRSMAPQATIEPTKPNATPIWQGDIAIKPSADPSVRARTNPPVPQPSSPTPFQVDPRTRYILSLSWSPQYCADEGGNRNDQQCEQGRRYDFVVHGLWPQTEKVCSAPFIVEKKIEDRFSTLFPSLHLLRHEWQKHGRCHFESPESYFKNVESKAQSLRIPTPLRQPLQQIEWTAEQILTAFRTANPQSHPASFALHCRGKFFRELRQCLDGQLIPRPCEGRERGNCRHSSKLIIRPVR